MNEINVCPPDNEPLVRSGVTGKIFLKIMLTALPFGAAAQSIHVTSNGHLVQTGKTFLVLQDLSFVNDGVYSGDDPATVEFTGSTIPNTAIGGTANTLFFNVLIAKPGAAMTLSRDEWILRQLTMNTGNLVLNGHTLILDSSGTLSGESEQSQVTDAAGGSIMAKVLSLRANVPANPGNVGAELLIPGPDSSIAGTYTVLRQHLATSLPGGLTSINRSYVVTSNANTSVIGQLRFFYLNTELNGNDASRLNLWSSTAAGNPFIEVGKDSSNLTAKWVVKSGINVLGLFTLGPDLQGGLIQPGDNKLRKDAKTSSDPAALANTAISQVMGYPNPTHDKFTLLLSSKESQKVSFSLNDQSGRLMQQKTVFCVAGTNTLSWDLSSYIPGIYYLFFNNEVVKIIKE